MPMNPWQAIRDFFVLEDTAWSAENLSRTLQAAVDRVADALRAELVSLSVFNPGSQKVRHFIQGGPGKKNQVDTAGGFSEFSGAGKLALVAPLLNNSLTLGTLKAFRRPEDSDFSREDQEFLDFFADYCSKMILHVDLLQELHRTNETSDTSNRTKTKFLTTMSHELRTPLFSVIGFTELLRMTELQEAQKNYVEALAVAGERLMLIINDALDLAKIEARQMSLEVTNFLLVPLILETVTLFLSQAKEKGIVLESHLSPELPESIWGDSARLRQILSNLLGNALRDAKEGRIDVVVDGSEEKNRLFVLKIVIRDTGTGIIQVGASRSGHYGGSALGLAISQKLCEMMGGSLRVETETGETSSFHFSLRVSTDRDLLGNADVQRPPTRVLSILMMTETLLNRLLFRTNAESLGHRVDTVETEVQLLSSFENGVYDAVFMDTEVTGLDVVEMARCLRTIQSRDRNLAIFALTAHPDEEASQCCAESGIAYLPSPVSRRRLDDVLGRFSG